MKGARPVVAAALAIALFAPPAGADGGGASSVWQRARRPDVERRRELAAEAEGYELKYHQLHVGRSALDRQEVAVLGDMYLARAAELLEQAGALTSSDLFLRYQLASVYAVRHQHQRLLLGPNKLAPLLDKAVALLESIGRADPPAPLRARVFAELAQSYAHLGRVDDEIKAYSESLRVQPVAHERSRLLANRAEAYMLLGDITPAVEGYRAALAILSNDHLMFGSGPTTLWGLAVALDRAGDLDSGLDAVRLARTYDAADRQINGPDWFYLPDYDRHWYEALGHWQVARKVEVVTSVRAAAYALAMASWARYVGAAAQDDKWLPLARVRLLECARDREKFLRRPNPHETGGRPSEFISFMNSLHGKDGEEARRLLLRWIQQHPTESQPSGHEGR